MPELLHIPFSPWSEKARWALDLCGVRYETRVYQPVVGELEVRRLLRRWRGPVTVPLLRDGERVFSDSFTIACYADRHATARKLFPKGEEARVAHYSELSERGLAAGRALALARMLESPEALRELLPKPLRGSRALVPVARAVIARTRRKYGGHLQPLAEHERVLREVLDGLRADLAASSSREQPKTLLSELSYADLAMAQVLLAVRPARSLPLGRASRKVFEDLALCEQYADLVSWRDALYERHRQPGRTSGVER